MKTSFFDSLTRTMAAPAPGPSLWQLVSGVTSAGILAFVGRTLAQPESVFATIAQSDGCLLLNHDGSCPPNTTKREKPGNVPTMNGCGPEGGSIKIPQGYG